MISPTMGRVVMFVTGIVPIIWVAVLVAKSPSTSVSTSSGADATAAAPMPCAASDGQLTLSAFPKGSLFAFSDGAWSSLCAGSVPAGNSANVACRQLGFEKAAGVFSAPWTLSLHAMSVDNFQCGGKETTLLECKKHELSAKTKPMCDLDASQGLECEGGEATVEALECSETPLMLRTQPPAGLTQQRGLTGPMTGAALVLVGAAAMAASFRRARQAASWGSAGMTLI